MRGRIVLLLFAMYLSVCLYAQDGRPIERGWTDKNNTERYAAYMLQIAYNDQGYWGVKVEIRQLGTERIFAVEPGPLYHVKQVDVSGLSDLPVQEVMAGCPRPGDVYSPDRMNDWILSIEKRYGRTAKEQRYLVDHAHAQATLEVTFR
jgi:outer membrane protein assembly factor BamA